MQYVYNIYFKMELITNNLVKVSRTMRETIGTHF